MAVKRAKSTANTTQQARKNASNTNRVWGGWLVLVMMEDGQQGWGKVPEQESKPSTARPNCQNLKRGTPMQHIPNLMSPAIDDAPA